MKNKFRNITISGDVGTGTSTLAKDLGKKLGWVIVSAGDIFREYHKKHNIPLWNKSDIPDELDKKVDHEFFEKMKTDEKIIFESHYSGWFARDLDDIYRILLICDKDLATKRIIDREHTHKETSGEIEERRKQLRAKFKKLYSSDNYEDPQLFNLVIDTTKTGIDETIEQTFKAFSKT
jgi:predicted cytidylate kinase